MRGGCRSFGLVQPKRNHMPPEQDAAGNASGGAKRACTTGRDPDGEPLNTQKTESFVDAALAFADEYAGVFEELAK